MPMTVPHKTFARSMAVLGLTVSIPLAATAAQAGQRALLIGIEEYQNVAQLEGPVDDAMSMQSFLMEHMGFQQQDIALIANEQATNAGIQNAFKQFLVNGTQPGDRVVIYYSGHGGQVPDTNGDEEDKLDETLVPVDARDDSPDDHRQLTDDDFGALLAMLEGRDVTVIIDACHSGTIARGLAEPTEGSSVSARTPLQGGGARAAPESIMAHREEESYVTATPGMRVWSAASAFQYAWEENGVGLFTKYFIEGAGERLADMNGNGVVSNAELIAYVRDKSEAWCRMTPDCANLSLGLTPVLEASSEDMAKIFVPIGAPPAAEPDEIIVQDNQANIEIAVLPSNQNKVGEQVWFEVTSEQEGWLILLDINADGEIVQLIPNSLMSEDDMSHRIPAGQPVKVPGDASNLIFTAAEPVGDGMLVAIVTEDNVDLDQVLAPGNDLNPVEDPQAYLSEISRALTRVWSRDDSANRELNWSMTTFPYTISR